MRCLRPKHGGVAHRYARALFDLAYEGGKTGDFLAELTRFDDASRQEPRLLLVLEDKEVPLKTKRTLILSIASLLSLSPLVCNAISLLADKGRIGLFPDIVYAYRNMEEGFQRLKRVAVRIATASHADLFKERIEHSLSDAFKQRIQCETSVDASIIGGAVIKIGDIVLDASIAGKLARMREELL